MNQPNKLPYYPEFPANELADPKKQSWDAEQWGWYLRLKMCAWLSDPKGRILEKEMPELAKASLNKQNLARWKKVVNAFEKDGLYRVHSDLANLAKEKTGQGKKRKLAGMISATERELKSLGAEDPRRAEVQRRLAELRSRTEAGQEQAPAPAPKPAKTARTTGKTGGNVPDPAPAAAPVLEYGPLEKNAKGQFLWNGTWVWPSFLQKQLEALKEKLGAQKVKLQDIKSRGGTSESISHNVCSVQLLQTKVWQVEFALGLRDNLPPVPQFDITPPRDSSRPPAENIESLQDAQALLDLRREYQSRITSILDDRNSEIVYTSTGKLSAFARRRISAAEETLQRVEKRLAELGAAVPQN